MNFKIVWTETNFVKWYHNHKLGGEWRAIPYAIIQYQALYNLAHWFDHPSDIGQ
jgi:hypothetical protein